MIALLVERISLVPSEGEEDVYCFDRQRTTWKHDVEVIDDEVIPVNIEVVESDSDRWRKCIAFWCFQKDGVVSILFQLIMCSNEKLVFEPYVIIYNVVIILVK